MKDKIYKIVHNALVINDIDNSSILYNKSLINNNFEKKISSMDELYQIFSKSSEDIFKCDTKGCLTLILDNGREISLNEWSVENPIFMKITDPELSKLDNDIIISLDKYHKIHECTWLSVSSYNDIPDYFRNDNLNAYRTCIRLQNLRSTTGDFDPIAVNYCLNIKIPINNEIYQGYLPGIQQLQFICKYIDLINYLMKNFETINLNLNRKGCAWWSCTKSGKNVSPGKNYFDYFKYIVNCEVDDGHMSFPRIALPLFHKSLN